MIHEQFPKYWQITTILYNEDEIVFNQSKLKRMSYKPTPAKKVSNNF